MVAERAEEQRSGTKPQRGEWVPINFPGANTADKTMRREMGQSGDRVVDGRHKKTEGGETGKCEYRLETWKRVEVAGRELRAWIREGGEVAERLWVVGGDYWRCMVKEEA